jgi:hypothetical protein
MTCAAGIVEIRENLAACLLLTLLLPTECGAVATLA